MFRRASGTTDIRQFAIGARAGQSTTCCGGCSAGHPVL